VPIKLNEKTITAIIALLIIVGVILLAVYLATSEGEKRG